MFVLSAARIQVDRGAREREFNIHLLIVLFFAVRDKIGIHQVTKIYKLQVRVGKRIKVLYKQCIIYICI